MDSKAPSYVVVSSKHDFGWFYHAQPFDDLREALVYADRKVGRRVFRLDTEMVREVKPTEVKVR